MARASCPCRNGRVFAWDEEASRPGVREPSDSFSPLPEQRRIADILDKADAIWRKRKEAIALTEELLRSAFLEMVGPQANGYAGWPEVEFESLAAPGPGAMRTGPFGSDLRHSEFVDAGVAVLGIDNAVRNRFAWDERRYITKEKYERLKRYTVNRTTSSSRSWGQRGVRPLFQTTFRWRSRRSTSPRLR